jgi:hypothetical protein
MITERTGVVTETSAGRDRARAGVGGSTATTGDRTSGGVYAVGGVSDGAGAGTI